MVRPKIIVVGGTGFIGRPLLEEAAKSMIVHGTSASGAGLTMRFNLEAPDNFDYGILGEGDVVFLAAAISAPDVCAKDPAHAWRINVAGTSEFIHRVIGRGGRVVFFSSDTVYGERSLEFDEQACCNPAGAYAEMKHEVEKRFLGNPLFKVIRLSYVFSHDDKFTRYLSGCAERGEEAELFHPFYRAIIHRDDVVEGALVLAQRWDEFPQSIINFGGPEVLARTEFAKSLQGTALPGLCFRVTEPGDDFFENRPKVIRMVSPILTSLLGRPLHTLREAARIEFNLK